MIYLPMVISGVAVGPDRHLPLQRDHRRLSTRSSRSLGLPGDPWQSDGAGGLRVGGAGHAVVRVGFNMIIYLAGLQGGAHRALRGRADRGRRRLAAVPAHHRAAGRPVARFFLLIMNVIYSFQVFDIIFVLTNGGPGIGHLGAGHVRVQDRVRAARDQGYGAAIGVVIFLITLAFTIVQWRSSRDPGRGGVMAVTRAGHDGGDRLRPPRPQATAPRRRRRGGAGLAGPDRPGGDRRHRDGVPVLDDRGDRVLRAAVFTGQIDLWPDGSPWTTSPGCSRSWPVLRGSRTR